VASVLATGSSFSAAAVSSVWTHAALFAQASAQFSQLAFDSADTNFTTIARPSLPTASVLSKAKDFTGIKNASALAATTNAANLNAQRMINLAAALYVTASRLNGANAANNTLWSNRQAAALRA